MQTEYKKRKCYGWQNGKAAEKQYGQTVYQNESSNDDCRIQTGSNWRYILNMYVTNSESTDY